MSFFFSPPQHAGIRFRGFESHGGTFQRFFDFHGGKIFGVKKSYGCKKKNSAAFEKFWPFFYAKSRFQWEFFFFDLSGSAIFDISEFHGCKIWSIFKSGGCKKLKSHGCKIQRFFLALMLRRAGKQTHALAEFGGRKGHETPKNTKIATDGT